MARILKNVLETWGNLLLLKQYKLQYYWARPELWERFWRLEETCYWSHANYSIIVSSQNIEKYFGDLRKLVVTETIQTTVLLSWARTLRKVLETWGNLLLKSCKLQYYWAQPEYWEVFWWLRKLVVTEAMQTTVLLSSARIPRRILETWGNLLLLNPCKLQYYWARPEYWKGFGDLRILVVTEAMQTTVLLSSARILRRILEIWGNQLLVKSSKLQYYWARPEYWEGIWRLEGNLLLLNPCKLQYYWARPEYWEGFWRLEQTCCYWSHANYSIIELGQNTEKGFVDLRKLVVTEAMQTTLLLSSARILRRDLETWGKPLSLKPCKLQYYWAWPDYWEGFWRYEETCCYWSHANYSIIELGQNTEKAFRDLRKIVATEAMKQQYYWARL